MNLEVFDSTEIPLTGSNLIEASAGTGKTYSIAILLLRMLLEEKLAIGELLMVTFTKAAVAELQERVRLFVRKAYQASNGGDPGDEVIAALVRRASEHGGAEAVRSRMREAVLLLDETSVMTIHSFCQQTLSEFAFETGQLFGAETLKDQQLLTGDAVNRFWRRNVAVIRLDLLEQLIGTGLSRDNITQVVASFLSGKTYISYEPGGDYTFTAADQAAAWDELSPLLAAVEACRANLRAHLRDNLGALTAATQQNRYASKAFLPLITDRDAFIDLVIEKRTTGYVQQLYAAMLPGCDQLLELKGAIHDHAMQVISHLYHMAISQVSRELEAYKQRHSLLSFDDMIAQLHLAVGKDESGRLRTALQQKYKAVFIDEFQDTDKLQFEIFDYLFGRDCRLFYIGDPKQSIYAFRKADIFTYFKAALGVDRAYSMDTNYRSAPALIAAMNQFFLPEPGFDTFAFGDVDEGITYIPVQAPAGLTEMGLYKGSSACVPMIFYEGGNKAEVGNIAAKQILDLLSDPGYSLRKTGTSTPVMPSDIGVLVRQGSEGRLMKELLGKLGIPAVTVDDARVLDSSEARSVLHLLNAFEEVNRAAINKALLAPFMGIDREALLRLDGDALQALFIAYGLLWEEQGIYVALTRFWAEHGVRARLMNDRENGGERVMTNLVQLTELLHKVQTSKQLVNIELINWLRRAVEGMPVEGDEYEQRVESDEQAVKIVTIHKSKGLEYPIVVAPFLDIKSSDNREFCSFRDADREEYLFARTEELTQAQEAAYQAQQEQENRRLLYVAVTRAAYQVFIMKNTSTRLGETSLKPFYEALKAGGSSDHIRFADPAEIPDRQTYQAGRRWEPLVPLRPAAFSLSDLSWRRLSYTFLAYHQPYLARVEGGAASDSYDDFVFRALSRGPLTGNFLHYIFERIDFTAEWGWQALIAQAVTRFIPGMPPEHQALMLDLIRHTIGAEIKIGDDLVRLSAVAQGQKISEFEFDFPVAEFNRNALNDLASEQRLILTAGSDALSGMMNGKMDLFFESGGRYYILDWKSNFLGDRLEHYDPASLMLAMNENNYHLQYQIYTLALKKYLEIRLPGFSYEQHFGGVIYLFFRGLRSGSRSGVYTCRPDPVQIARLEAVFQQ